MTRIYLTNANYGGAGATNMATQGVEIHAISVKDNFVVNNSKFNNPHLANDDSNMETRLVPLLMGNRTVEVMGYIHVDMYSGSDFDTKFLAMLKARSRLINFASKNAYSFFHYPNIGIGYDDSGSDTTTPIQGYIQGLEIREVPTGTPKPSYFTIIFNLIEGERIGD